AAPARAPTSMLANGSAVGAPGAGVAMPPVLSGLAPASAPTSMFANGSAVGAGSPIVLAACVSPGATVGCAVAGPSAAVSPDGRPADAPAAGVLMSGVGAVTSPAMVSGGR